MASVAGHFNSPVPANHRRSYISVDPFHDDIFSYSTSMNAQFVTTGTLTPLSASGANAGNCPRGRVLRETGKKLYPGANPGVETYLVSVYDAVSQLTGYIDPNAAVFTPYNTDKPYVLADGVDPKTDDSDRGAPVFTRGNAYIQGDMDLSGNLFASTITSDTTLTAGYFFSSLTTNNGGSPTSFNIYVDATKAMTQIFDLTYATGGTGSTYVYFGTGADASNGTITPEGSPVNLVIRNHTGNTQNVIFNIPAQVNGFGNIAAVNFPTSRAYGFQFVSNGTNYQEIMRGGAFAN